MPSQEKLLEVIRLQTDIVHQGLDVGATMSLVVERVLPLLGADGAAIELREGDEMVYRAVSGIAADNLGLRIPVHSSLSGLSTLSGEVKVCVDSENDDRVDKDACRKLGLRSMLVVPLRFEDVNVGVLKAMSGHPDYFTPEHRKLLQLLTELIAASMYFGTRLSSEELLHRATHDAMTGLANRALFMDRLRALTHQYQRNPVPFGVLMADINGLKKVNDTLGHRAGDALIIEFSRRLAKSARSTDLVARLGGDEFAVLLAPLDYKAGLRVVEDRVMAALAGNMEFDGRDLPISGSIGVALCPTDGQDMRELTDLADARMYRHKREHYQRQPV